MPAAIALLGDIVPEDRRGRAFGLFGSYNTAGFTLGPLIGGGLSQAFGLATPFLFTAIMAGLALIVVWVKVPDHEPVVFSTPALSKWYQVPYRKLWPYLLSTVGLMGLIGVYDTIWSIYMRGLGASQWVIALSFTLFGLPYLLFNWIGGRIADRWRHFRGHWIAWGTLVIIITVIGYALSRTVLTALIIGTVEAIAVSVVNPNLQAALMDLSPAQQRGQIQGISQGLGTLGAAISAIIAGRLLPISAATAFYYGALYLFVTWLVSLPGLLRIRSDPASMD